MDKRLKISERLLGIDSLSQENRVFFEDFQISEHDIAPLHIVESSDAVSCLVNYGLGVNPAPTQLAD